MKVAFAVPGDLATPTGGYAYDRAILAGLRATGREVTHLSLPAGFPFPTAAQTAAAFQRLRAVGRDTALMIDGLAFGALDPAAVAGLEAPLVALVHHPLARETGLSPAEATRLRQTEIANLNRVCGVIVTSPHTAAVLAQEYGVPRAGIVVAPPGVTRPAAPAAPETPPLILSVGTLSARKGHDVLLDALARLADLDWHAVIVGKAMDEDVAAALEAQARRLGLDRRVRFAGAMDHAELAEVFARASVFALATRYEGYGMVFAEALAHGLPIVTCRVGAVPDTVPAAAGRLVPADDPVAFADALAGVLRDPARRADLARAAWEAGRRLPTWEDTSAIVARALDTFTAAR